MNSKFSWLYDSKALLAITINGQLLLTMLAEALVDSIEDLTILQINTDGITVRILRSNLDLYTKVCKEWEAKTNLILEYVDYSKMVIQNVNNYLAVTLDGKVKYKGLFEIDKEFHKDTSFKIVPIALSNYFTKGISIKDTISNHLNIYDFCGRAKFKSDSHGETRCAEVDDFGNGVIASYKQQKTTRYYISNKGSTFIKVFPEKQKESFINKGYQVSIFNTFESKEDYDINTGFYIKECQKILNSIETKQLELF